LRDDAPLQVTPPPITANPLFASLVSLALIDFFLYSDNFPQWSTWLSPTSLPSLRRLSIGFSSYELNFISADADFYEALSRLAPQLEAFSLTAGASETGLNQAFPWSSLTSLRTLALFPYHQEPVTLVQHALSNLGGSLSKLRIGDVREQESQLQMGTSWDEDVLGVLLQMFAEAPSVRKPTMLSIESINQGTDEEMAESVEKLSQVMDTQGGSLEYRSGWEGQGELLQWERFFEPW
jgi:hypothetical protein